MNIRRRLNFAMLSLVLSALVSVPVLGIECDDWADTAAPILTFGEDAGDFGSSNPEFQLFNFDDDGCQDPELYRWISSLFDVSNPLNPTLVWEGTVGCNDMNGKYQFLYSHEDLVVLGETYDGSVGRILVFDPSDQGTQVVRNIYGTIVKRGSILWGKASDRLVAYDLQDWPDLVEVDSLDLPYGQLYPGPENEVSLLRTADLLYFVDLRDTASAQILGSYDPQGSTSPGYIYAWDPNSAVVYSGLNDYNYSSGQTTGTLLAIGYSDPQNPTLLDELTWPAAIRVLGAYEDNLVVVFGQYDWPYWDYGTEQFQIVGTQDPQQLTVLSPVMDIPASAGAAVLLERSGEFLYVGRGSYGISMYDLSDPSLPQIVGYAAGDARTLHSVGRYLVADGKIYLKDCLDAVSVPLPAKPGAVQLSKPVPNPFNPLTTVEFVLDTERKIDLRIFDLHGRCVGTLAEGFWPAGVNRVNWAGKDYRGRQVSSGAYFFRLRTGEFDLTTRAVLVR